MEPLLELADTFRTAVGYPVEVLVLADPSAAAGSPRAEDLSVVIDFPEGVVRLGHDGERCRYRFRVARPLIERLLADGEVDWSNSLFLSMRFVAHRAGAYNEHVYTWFKCQAVDRLEYAEGWYAELEHSDEETVLGRVVRPKPVPAHEGRPVALRGGGRDDADLPHARLAVGPRDRSVPDVDRSRAAGPTRRVRARGAGGAVTLASRADVAAGGGAGREPAHGGEPSRDRRRPARHPGA